MINTEVFVRVGDKTFIGRVRHEFGNGDIQVEMRAAKLISKQWETLVFNARGNAIVGIATVHFPETLADFAALAALND
jgi:hypothetical protein